MPALLRMELFPRDMQRAMTFYTNILRFTVLRDESPNYAYLQRDSIYIGLGNPRLFPPNAAPVDETYRPPPTGVEIVIEVDDIQEERDLVVKAGCEIVEDLKRQAWGLVDFRIVDPDGHYLRLTEHGKTRDGRGVVEA